MIIIGTPNSELLGKHGFSYNEMIFLFSVHFTEFIIFENALVPFENKERWLMRKKNNAAGLIVSQKIIMEETVLPEEKKPEFKVGIKAISNYDFNGLKIDLSLLHNTHSWIVIAKNNK